MTHELKILECYANAKLAGDKLFEIRNNLDRGFQKGDIVKYIVVNDSHVRIRNHPMNSKEYEITYVTNYEQKEGWVVFGEREVNMNKSLITSVSPRECELIASGQQITCPPKSYIYCEPIEEE